MIARLHKAAVADAPLRDSALHGEEHWLTIASAAIELARLDPRLDALTLVVFALWHDARRVDEWADPGHGTRAAVALRASVGRDAPAFVELAARACELHDTGHVEHHDLTIAAACDLDRLQLGRVGIEPDPAFLVTQQARDAASGDRELVRMLIDPPLLTWAQAWARAAALQSDTPERDVAP